MTTNGWSNEKIAVIGAGTMGTGIAQIAATNRHPTVLVDTNVSQLEMSEAGLTKLFSRLVEKNRFTEEESASILSRIQFTSDVAEVSGASLVVEAIVEDLDTKKDLFRSVESTIPADTILATNTSSLSVTAIAGGCSNPNRVVGMHFFNPAPLMALVEVVPALGTSTEVVQSVTQLAQQWDKEPVTVKDTPGFIVNRVARPFYGEALRIVDEGVATPGEIDQAMREVGGFRMGPFELMDLIGNDINLKVTETVFRAFYNDPRYKPSFTQKRLVEAGRLGRKSGMGYYDYSQSDWRPSVEVSDEVADKIVSRITTMIMNEAIDAVFWAVATPAAIDTAMTKGVNYPRGPIALAHDIGLENVLKQMQDLRDLYAEDRYRPSPLLKQLVNNGSTLI